MNAKHLVDKREPLDGKCMVCGAFTELRIPLTFCDKCRHTPEADAIRKEYHEYVFGSKHTHETNR